MSPPLRQHEGIAASVADPRIQRYRQAERALWGHYGLEPTERFVEVDSLAVQLRVLETGSGEPLLFVHGSAAGGPIWAPLVSELQDFRCLVIDRPGWGLSSTVDYSQYEYKSVVSDLLVGVLDGLGVDRAHVIGGSIGNVWALRLAAAHLARVDRVVLMGGGPMLSEVPIPPIIRLIASPIGALMVRLPAKPGRERSILRDIGHRDSLDAGRMDEFINWRVVLARDTDSIRNERAMMRAVLSWRRGAYRPGLTFEDEELAAIRRPVLHV
jgi:pimeloyl-ACP methyl ester carboxylesterase